MGNIVSVSVTEGAWDEGKERLSKYNPDGSLNKDEPTLTTVEEYDVGAIVSAASEISNKASDVALNVTTESQSGGQSGGGYLKTVNLNDLDISLEGFNVSDNAYDAASGNTGLIANEYFSNEIQGFYDTSTGQMLDVSPEDLQNVEFLKSLSENENIVAVFGYGEKGTLDDVSGFVNIRELQGLINESLEQQNETPKANQYSVENPDSGVTITPESTKTTETAEPTLTQVSGTETIESAPDSGVTITPVSEESDGMATTSSSQTDVDVNNIEIGQHINAEGTTNTTS